MTNNPTSSSLSKICTNCGQQKPLSAFLEMTEAHGTIYGSICSTCRKTALMMEENRRKTDAEGSTTSETGNKIDAKSKLHSDIDKRETKERTEKEYHEERDINELVSDEVREKKHLQEHEHRKQRDNSFLQRRSFISETKPSQTQPTMAKIVTQNNQQAVVKTAIEQEHRKNTGIETQFANQGQQISGQERYKSSTFQSFRDYLGSASHLVSNKDQATKTKEASKAKNPAVEYIEKNWNPGSGRKR